MLIDLQEVSELMHTQDNRITAEPIFVVERKIKITTNPDYECHGYVWYNKEQGEEADEREKRILDKLSEKDFGVDLVNEMYHSRNKKEKRNPQWYLDKIEHYKQENDRLREKFNINQGGKKCEK